MTLQTDSILTSGIAFSYTSVGQSYTILPNVSVISTNDIAILSNWANCTLTIAGTVGNDLGGFTIRFNSANAHISISAAGQVISGANSASAAILMAGQGSIENSGSIIAATGIGIMTTNDGNQIVNFGTISTGSTAVFMGLGQGTNDNLINYGTITANAVEADVTTQNGHGVLIDGNDCIIDNFGTIAAGFGNGVAVGDGFGSISGDGSVINNHGTIMSSAAWGISFANLSAGESILIRNFGVISGGFGGIRGNDADDGIINRGTIVGSVDLGAGADVYDGIGGQVEGPIYGGAGNDTFMISDPDAVLAELQVAGTDLVIAAVDWTLGVWFENLTLSGPATRGIGNALDNIITGNIHDNILAGNAGNDVLNGDSGDDRLDGDIGKDTLNGGVGDDVLRGRSDDDRLSGSAGQDLLAGGTGNDILDGGSGDDTLIGGVGRDKLTGGEDADQFVFLAAGDSGATGATRDTVADFASGVDLIDLSGIDASTTKSGNQAFTFIGTTAFSGTAGQLQVTSGAGFLLLSGDRNGDSVADFVIELTGLAAILDSDILL